MKRASLLFFLLLFLCNAWGYFIESFDAEITVYSTATIKVVERITVDFEDESHRHGIYRDITFKYKTKMGNKYNLRLDVVSITDANGAERTYNVTKQGRDVRIRIGDADKCVEGVQSYVITYEVTRAINFFKEHDELWWEVTGQNWECSIHSASATVTLPPKTSLDNVKATCYTGEYGSTAQDCQWTIVPEGLKFVSGYLAAGQGLSIVVGLPKGILTKPSIAVSISQFLADNWLWILCLPIPFVLFILLLFNWIKNGRDPMQNASVMVRYDPPANLSPAEMGTVMDERADISDITSSIVDLAVRGYLKIVETKSEKILFFSSNDYAIVQMKDFYQDAGDLTDFELQLLNYLFTVGEDKDITPASLGVQNGIKLIFISSLKNKFYSKIPDLKSKLYKKLVADNYFPSNPESVRARYSTFGVIFLIIGIILAFSLQSFAIAWALIPTAIMFFIFAPIMPRKTQKGAAALLHAKGLEEFIHRAEEDRIRKMSHEDPTVFERLLPYAMVLGCADEWVEKFKDMFKGQPDWYVSDRPMTGYLFVNNLGSAMNSVGSSMTSRPRGSSASGGGSGFSGGFSGGGFGGGGGGAW